jgi:hypothetical protein
LEGRNDSGELPDVSEVFERFHDNGGGHVNGLVDFV